MGGYMSNRTYQCTRCNEVFTYNSDRDALYCPICGSTARYVSKPTATVNQTTASGKYYNVVFTDPSTGVKIGSATVPDNWKYGASLKSYNQSLLVNYLSICQVQKNDNTALMFVKTGDNFLDVRNGIFQNETHQDGQIDRNFNIPMLRLDSTENYISSIAPGFVQNAKLTAKAVSKLPSYYAENSKVFQREMDKELKEFAAYFNKNNDITFEAGAPVTESKLVQYTYTQNKTKYVMLLGTDLGAYEFRLTTQSAANNNMMSLLTSLVTGRNNQTNVGQYIHWGSKLIFGLITTEANYDSVVGDFLKFVNTFKLDTSYKTNIKKLASGRPSQNTSSGNGGLSLTDILTGILNATNQGTSTSGNNTSQGFDWTSLFREDIPDK